MKREKSEKTVNAEEIYDYYRHDLIPALTSSLPLLMGKMRNDTSSFVYNSLRGMMHLLIPFTRDDFEWHPPHVPNVASEAYGNVTQFLLSHLDTNADGHISTSELIHLNLEQHFPQIQRPNFHVPSGYTGPLISRLTSWPLIDWNLATLLWRSCGGLLILIIIASIIPGRLHEWSGRILRWPVLALTYLTIASELVVYIIVRLLIKTFEYMFSTKKHRDLRMRLNQATTYQEWSHLAKKLDFSQSRDRWIHSIDDDSSYKYNWSFINELIADMREARSKDDIMLALVVLQQCTRKNVGGIMNEDLFSFTNSGEPKAIVREFVDEVVKTLHWLTNLCKKSSAKSSDESTKVEKCHQELNHAINVAQAFIEHTPLHHVVEPVQWALHHVAGGGNGKAKSITTNEEPLPPTSKEVKDREQVTTFLKRARASYGRTALCLSGGAMMGCYHFGHVMALLDEGVLPHIISGTSAGSVIAAILCTRTDEEIRRDMRAEILVNKLTCFSKSWPDRFKNVYENGCLFDQKDWLNLIGWFTCGNMTFEEAYRKTGRILCITLSSTTKKAPPVLVNYITAPNVTICSAIIASAAVPGFIKPVVLQKKGADGVVRDQAANKDEAYWDGSIDQDIPTSGLAEMFNCQFFLTAQCNPHVVPFFHSSKGCVGQPSRWVRGQGDKAWRGGFLLAAVELYLKNDMRSKFHFLNDMEAAVGFTSTMMTQIFHGSTTIVPNISVSDYFCLFSNPTQPYLEKCFQVGKVAAFKHCEMMKLHYSISNALDECLAILENEDDSTTRTRRRVCQLAKMQYFQEMNKLEDAKSQLQNGKAYALNTSNLPQDLSLHEQSSSHSLSTHSTHVEDEFGFEGVQMDPPLKRPFSKIST
ncbi:hypothetical protein CTEN210_14382 [Chaetoceros tenuissimus]|uniref:PNPLA domain-containing protein n=1 Tax=Chaetoceros tenuissimus TaxID=426638 RepID=A0AAD3D746_9STRA|nr:hypothetical protein CTEN210_14382 [Chaetoceros tenuissimus]